MPLRSGPRGQITDKEGDGVTRRAEFPRREPPCAQDIIVNLLAGAEHAHLKPSARGTSRENWIDE
jgi:hypothetical protein